MKVGDLVRHGGQLTDKDWSIIGIIVKVSDNRGRPPRSKVNWFGKYTPGWWDNYDLRIVSEDW